MNADTQQKCILTGIFGGSSKKNFITVLSSDITSFERPSYDYLWKRAIRYHKKCDDLLTWPVYRSLVSKSKLGDDIKKLYLVEAKPLFDHSMYKKIKKDGLIKYSIEELNNYSRASKFLNIISDFRTKANSGDIDELGDHLDSVVAKMVSELASKKQPDYVIVDFASTFEKRQEARRKEKEEPDTYKKFTYRENDIIMNKVFKRGFRKGECIGIAGSTNSGKSVETIDIASRSAELGFNTLLIVSENSIEQTEGRLDSNISGKKYDEIQDYGFQSRHELKEFEKSYQKKLSETVGDRIKVVKIAPNGSSVVTIIRILNDLKAKKWIADVIIIDSPAHLKPSIDVKTSNDNYTRLSKAAIAWELKGLAIENNVIMFCTYQLTRDVAKRKDLASIGSDDIADAYEIARVLDVFIIIAQTVALYVAKKIAKLIRKYRDGHYPQEPILYYDDRSRMRLIPCNETSDDGDISTDDNDDITEDKVKELKKKKLKVKADGEGN